FLRKLSNRKRLWSSSGPSRFPPGVERTNGMGPLSVVSLCALVHCMRFLLSREDQAGVVAESNGGPPIGREQRQSGIALHASSLPPGPFRCSRYSINVRSPRSGSGTLGSSSGGGFHSSG